MSQIENVMKEAGVNSSSQCSIPREYRVHFEHMDNEGKVRAIISKIIKHHQGSKKSDCPNKENF
jgi:hypothetical protein